MSAPTRVVTNHKHLMRVTGDHPDDRSYSIVCPNGGKDCECWQECGKEHRCDCGPHPHDDTCDPGCEVDHAMECDEWLWDEHPLHGEEHRYVSGTICVRVFGCWMPDWDIEFDETKYRDLYPPGVYEFSYEDPDDDMSGLLYILAMRPVSEG